MLYEVITHRIHSHHLSLRLVQKYQLEIRNFFKLTSGISARVILEASLMPGSEWLGSEKERSSVKTDPVVFSRNGQIIEVLEDI